MHVKTKAIVLNSLKYGESQIIVDLLTECVGRVSFMQRIPRSSRSGISKQLFQPLTILDVHGRSAQFLLMPINLALPCSWQNL